MTYQEEETPEVQVCSDCGDEPGTDIHNGSRVCIDCLSFRLGDQEWEIDDTSDPGTCSVKIPGLGEVFITIEGGTLSAGIYGGEDTECLALASVDIEDLVR